MLEVDNTARYILQLLEMDKTSNLISQMTKLNVGKRKRMCVAGSACFNDITQSSNRYGENSFQSSLDRIYWARKAR